MKDNKKTYAELAKIASEIKRERASKEELKMGKKHQEGKDKIKTRSFPEI